MPPQYDNRTVFVLRKIHWSLLDGAGRREEIRRPCPRNDHKIEHIRDGLLSDYPHYVRLDCGYTSNKTLYRYYRVLNVEWCHEDYSKSFVNGDGTIRIVEWKAPYWLIRFIDDPNAHENIMGDEDPMPDIEPILQEPIPPPDVVVNYGIIHYNSDDEDAAMAN
jgi:hypothetical protein